MKNNHVQANVEEVINSLTQQIAKLTYDNAVLQSLVNQYRQQQSDMEGE